MVFGSFCAGSIHTLSTSRTNMQYLLTNRPSATLHSRFAKHSATSGGATSSAGTGVRPNLSNLSTFRPEQLPTSTTLAANSSAGMAITHSFVARNAAKLWFLLLTTQATSGGSNSTIMCHDRVMPLGRPRGRSSAGPPDPAQAADRLSTEADSSLYSHSHVWFLLDHCGTSIMA